MAVNLCKLTRTTVIATTLLLSACATAPQQVAAGKSEGFDRSAPIADIQELHRRDRTVIDDPEVTQFVQTIRKRLELAAGASCDCVVLVDSAVGYEGYSLSANTIVLASGVIAQAESEDEVAAVLAHELGHVYKKDFKSGGSKEAFVDITKLAAVAAGAGGQAILFGDYLDAAATDLVFHQWNAEQEILADQFAAELLGKANYSLDGLKMAVRRIGEHGAEALAARDNAQPKCVTMKGDTINWNPLLCGQNMKNNSRSVYKKTDDRLEAVTKVAFGMPSDIRRRAVGGPAPKFESVSYVFGLSDLYSTDRKTAEAEVIRIVKTTIPSSLNDNVAITNQLFKFYVSAHRSDLAKPYAQKMLSSTARTVYTFNELYKYADQVRDPKLAQKFIDDAHIEVGLSDTLLPVEYYLARKYNLQLAMVTTYGRCFAKMASDIKTMNRCADFDKNGSKYAGGRW